MSFVNALLGKTLVSSTRRRVARTGEFIRIRNLPRRVWDQDESLAEATSELEKWLHLKGGDKPCGPNCECPRSLWPNQAAALIELAQGGVFCPQGVGRGKAMISILAATVIDAKRPVLFVPAQLRDQTNRKVLPLLRRHWRINPALKVIGYSELSLAKNRDMLERLRPDLLIFDECHSVSRSNTARTRRVRSYLRMAPDTVVVALSGTITRRSIRDYWQILLWTLGERAPLPQGWHEMGEWADAIDDGAELPCAPGALLTLEGDDKIPLVPTEKDKERARELYRDRLVQSPGVVSTGESELGTSLEITQWQIEPPREILEAIERMRRTWQTPNGDEITEASELWRHAREIACGFYYIWQPAAPKEWLFPRKEWKRCLRGILARNRRGLDSELLVTNWIAHRAKAGEQSLEIDLWKAWTAVKDMFEPNTVPMWMSDFATKEAARWLKATRGICWVEHVAFGERMRELGFRYFGAGAKASAEILDAEGPIVASIAAHGLGKNLQRWNRNLIVSPPSSGKTWEQLLGRTHRHGQAADTVMVDVALHAPELLQSFDQARRDARYIEQTTGARQKLCYADTAIQELEE